MATGRDIDSATKTDINSLRYSQSGFRPDVAHSVFIYAPAGGEPAIKTYASEPVNENCFSLFSAAPPKAAAKQRCFSYRRWDDGASFGDSHLTTIQPPLGAAPLLCTSSMSARPFQPCAHSSILAHPYANSRHTEKWGSLSYPLPPLCPFYKPEN